MVHPTKYAGETAQESDEARHDPNKALPLNADGRMTARVLLAAGLVALALWTAVDFLPSLIWAAILAVALWPLYASFAEALTGVSSNLAAILFTLIVAIVLFTPMSLAVYQIAQQSDSLLNWVNEAKESGIKVPQWISRLPWAADTVHQWWNDNLTDPRAASEFFKSVNADKLSEIVKTFGGQLIHRFFMLLVALVALFILLRHGRSSADLFMQTCDRILGNPGDGLVDKVVHAIRGTVNGTVVVAVGEGLLIGVAYFIAGVPNAILFTILTAAFAMLPFGAWAAFTAAAITLASSGGNELAAVGVFGWGALVMLAGDHFVWPTLVGDAARLPFLFAFIGIFGGLATFGLLGLFLGPVIMAALLTVWREWVVRQPRAQADCG
jgi:predicted PurR-regulated permease PerM